MKKNEAEFSRTNGTITGIWYKILRIFSDVHPGEALTVLLLTLNGFLLFLAYYIIKPLRDALMLDSWPAEIKISELASQGPRASGTSGAAPRGTPSHRRLSRPSLRLAHVRNRSLARCALRRLRILGDPPRRAAAQQIHSLMTAAPLSARPAIEKV